ncbi:hypothetical protein EMPS_09742 [Entomortierella parvispora]|uniref:F-box domain-containing protein n=1 Tax=Entomortierella parvispora TaxID=205924 RepID=A0A9P3HIY4_9FUNG|nr:hypothetical protein EMPS_09742 [Entomortierella parvispora]
MQTTMDSPIKVILAIPELAEAVLVYLTRSQILLLRLVSKAWHQLCEPHFYLHYHVGLGQSLLELGGEAFDQDDEEAPDHIHSIRNEKVRHRQCIRSVTLNGYKDDPIRLLSRFCPNSLTKLILIDAIQEDLETLGQVAYLMNELRTLEIRPTARDTGADLLLSALSQMPNKRLESFKLGPRRLGMISLRWNSLIGFLNSATGLKSLSLGTIDFLAEEIGGTTQKDIQDEGQETIRQRIMATASAPSRGSAPSPGPFTNIQMLQLGNSVMSKSQVMDFMSMLPNISTIDLRFGLGSWSPLFLDSLMATGLVQFPTLKRLNLTWYTVIELVVLVWFLEASPNLQYLGLAGQWTDDGSSGLPRMTEIFQNIRIRLRGLQFSWWDQHSESAADMMAFLNLKGCHNLEEVELSQNPSFLHDIMQVKENGLERQQQQTELTSAGTGKMIGPSPSQHYRPQDERQWFPFSQSLTSLRLTGHLGLASSLDLTKALNKLLGQLPRLVDLSVTASVSNYSVFDGLGQCHRAASSTEEEDGRTSWLGERPYLQSLTFRLQDGFRVVPEEFQAEVVDRFRFLDAIQLVADVKTGDNEVLEAWRRERLRPGLQLVFLWKGECLGERVM